MKNFTLPKFDFYRISEYDSLCMLSHLEDSHKTLSDAKAHLKIGKDKFGWDVAIDRYTDGLFITKYHFNGKEDYLISIIYL